MARSNPQQQRLAILSQQIDHREQARAGLALRERQARPEPRQERLRRVLERIDRSLTALKREQRLLLMELLNRHARIGQED